MIENDNTEKTEFKELEPKDIAFIEAILFLETNPIDETALNNITGMPIETIKGILESLNEKYSAPDSGIGLTRTGSAYMLAPKQEFWEDLKDRYGKQHEGKISRAAMETLSIIAYSQPVTRAEIEAIRGVSADNMIRLLVEKALIEEKGKKDIPGKPIQYGTTREFLKQFRLNSISELPRLNDSETDRFELEADN